MTQDVDLRQAFEDGQFHLVFQPQVHLTTGHVAGFEALLRWRHPQQGDLLPHDFIGELEGSGVAVPLTRWVIEQGVAHLRELEALGHRGLQITVNAPASVFETDEIERLLRETLKRQDISGNQLGLELPEAALSTASPAVIERLRELRGLGISVAVDDFGTGQLGLVRLTQLPLDCLKLDLRCVQGVVSDAAQVRVARAACELARSLRLRMVVEGIETPGQLRFFSELKCDVAQGHLFAAAMQPGETLALLQSGRRFIEGAAPAERSRHLLLLDDEPNILRSLRRVFRAQPWTVHTADTPDEAFELLARHPVGVVMSDQRMPLMRGTDFLARVKQLYPDTVRIVLSGYTELQSVTEAINEGAIYKFLTKPWNDQQLNEEIERAFRQFEMVSESQLLQQRLHETNRLLETRLQRNEERLQREEAMLDVTHEALGAVPVPILGVDLTGMIAISNAAADSLLGGGASLVGEHVSDVLPAELADPLASGDCKGSRLVSIGESTWEARCSDLGTSSRGTGFVVTLLQGGRA